MTINQGDTSTSGFTKGEMLIAILNDPADLARLRSDLWYRIPVETAPRRWPPHYLAFYQTKTFGDEKYAVRHYGKVRRIDIVPRRQLFPDEFENPKSSRLYHKVQLEALHTLAQPIISYRGRRLVFVPSTLRKFERATEINDLFDDSPLEDDLWAGLKDLKIRAERQWDERLGHNRYMLDFAVFCRDRQLDIETDGDTWHADRSRIAKDNLRDNQLNANKWHVLRFNGRQVHEQLATYVLPQITEAINKYGGLAGDGPVSAKYLQTNEGIAVQKSLLE